MKIDLIIKNKAIKYENNLCIFESCNNKKNADFIYKFRQKNLTFN